MLVTDTALLQHALACAGGPVLSDHVSRICTRAHRRSFGDDTSYWSFARNRLFRRIGARSFTFQVDPSGTFLGGSHAFMTARDWARFGQLYLQVRAPVLAPITLSHARRTCF